MCLSLPAVCFFSYFQIHLNLSASFLLYAHLFLHQSLSLIVHTLSVNLLFCISHFIYLGSFFVYSCSPHLPAYPNHLLSRPFLCLCTFPPLIITYIHSFYPPAFFSPFCSSYFFLPSNLLPFYCFPLCSSLPCPAAVQEERQRNKDRDGDVESTSAVNEEMPVEKILEAEMAVEQKTELHADGSSGGSSVSSLGVEINPLDVFNNRNNYQRKSEFKQTLSSYTFVFLELCVIQLLLDVRLVLILFTGT